MFLVTSRNVAARRHTLDRWLEFSKTVDFEKIRVKYFTKFQLMLAAYASDFLSEGYLFFKNPQ
ncbi:hypothetical protein ACX27_07190 [Nostoc piscinale CENA21]|uniref:Uncharacterized protein n=1 Tax=Nostoc piscinale CENA21 TaxID=224013 RepID=A0A0M3V4T1_9NOSO|nr:hypothetical protein ACX27_07190 [Nostoc piscinale CENA21]